MKKATYFLLAIMELFFSHMLSAAAPPPQNMDVVVHTIKPAITSDKKEAKMTVVQHPTSMTQKQPDEKMPAEPIKRAQYFRKFLSLNVAAALKSPTEFKTPESLVDTIRYLFNQRLFNNKLEELIFDMPIPLPMALPAALPTSCLSCLATPTISVYTNFEVFSSQSDLAQGLGQAFVNAGFDVDAPKTDRHRTALLLAIAALEFKAARVLLHAHASPFQKDSSGITPVKLAISCPEDLAQKSGWYKRFSDKHVLAHYQAMVRDMLMLHLRVINLQPEPELNTLLHDSILYANPLFTHILLQLGCDTSLQNYEHLTAAQMLEHKFKEAEMNKDTQAMNVYREITAMMEKYATRTLPLDLTLTSSFNPHPSQLALHITPQ